MKRTFVFQDEKSQKFWNIEVKGTDFTVTYGKLGTTGQSSSKSFETKEKCQKEANKLIAEKTKKGYKELAKGEAMPDKADTPKNTTAPKVAKEQKEIKFFKIDWTIDQLYKGCILASIANAISAAKFPLFSYEHSWDGINYSANNTSGMRGTVTFQGDYCVAAFRNEKCDRIGERESHTFVDYIPKEIKNDVIDIAIEHTLQYLLVGFKEKNGSKYTAPVITAFLCGKNNELFTEEPFEDFLENGGELLARQAMDTESAIEEWAEQCEMSPTQVKLLKSIYARKIANPNDEIIMTKKEIAMLGKDPSGLKESKKSFGELNIKWEEIEDIERKPPVETPQTSAQKTQPNLDGTGFYLKIPFIYDCAYQFESGLAAVERNRKWGFIDKNGNEVIKCIYDKVNDFREDLTPVERKGKYGFIDKNGNEILMGVYDYGHIFYDGFAGVERKGKWGFIDTSGKEVIKCVYDDVRRPFSDGIACVELNRKYGYIDKNGKEITQCVYDEEIGFDSSLLAAVRQKKKWGYINKNGNEATEFVYDYAYNFHEGFAQVSLNGKWGYIDESGKEALKCVYDDAGYFSGGLARVRLNGKYGYIDKTGKEIIKCIYDEAERFENGFARVKSNKKWGFVDTSGNEVIKCIYNKVWDFSKKTGLALVMPKGKWGYIDKNGNEVIKCLYIDIGGFSEGFAVVERNGKYGFIDESGNETLMGVYDYLDGFEEGLARVKFDDKYGFIAKVEE
jgi:predicted DNA-binding WGR domain protein